MSKPQHFQIRSWAFRLNQTILLGLGITGIAALIQQGLQFKLIQLPSFAIAATIAASGLVLLFNQFICQRLERLRYHSVEDNPALLCISLAATTALCLGFYILLNQPVWLFWAFLSALQAQLNHQSKLAFALSISTLITALTSNLFSPALSVITINSSGLLNNLSMVLLCSGMGYWGVTLKRVFMAQEEQVETLQSLASTDTLTHLVNRRQFNNRLQAEVSRSKRHSVPLALALIDIDNFKHINDHYGHPIGDRILKELGLLISKNIRESDVAARYGGEELALILPETGEKEATDLLNRLRQLIAETVFCMPDNPLTITVSVGVSELAYRQKQANAMQFIERADQALYQAKASGKNAVIASSQLILPFMEASKLRKEKPLLFDDSSDDRVAL